MNLTVRCGHGDSDLEHKAYPYVLRRRFIFCIFHNWEEHDPI
jgi:hypothetical protein